MVLVGGRNIGAMRKAIGHNGPLRNSAESQGTWRNAEEHQKGALFPRIRLFFAVFALFRFAFSPSPFPYTQRFGDFETPGIGRWVDCRSEKKGRWAQWTTAALGGVHGTMDNGKTDKMGRRGNWRNPTEPDGTPRNTNRGGHTASNPLFFSCFQSRSSRFLFFPPLPRYPTFQWFRNAGYMFGGRNIGVRRKASGHNVPLRNPTEPEGTPGTPTGGIIPPNPPICRGFLQFSPYRFPFPPPFPNTQRFGCFETPGNGWGGGIHERRARKVGTTDHHGTRRNLHGSPTGWHYALKPTFFVVFALWILSFSPCIPLRPIPNISAVAKILALVCVGM